MRRTIVAIALALTGLLTACGDGGASATELIAAAPEATKDQGSARMAMSMEMTGGAQDVTVTAEGAMEFATQKATMTMDLGAMGAQAGMGKLEMITDAQTIYMKMPNAEQLGLPTPWLKMDLQSMAGMQGMGDLSQLNSNDPARAMEMLRGVSGDIEEVGTEDVRGTSTTHYKATMDLDKALEQVPADSRKAVKQQFDTLGTSTIPTEIWIDEEGLLRRQRSTIDLSNAEGMDAAGGQAPTGMVVDIELFDFGAEVNVDPPPAKQVTDFAKLQAGG